MHQGRRTLSTKAVQRRIPRHTEDRSCQWRACTTASQGSVVSTGQLCHFLLISTVMLHAVELRTAATEGAHACRCGLTISCHPAVRISSLSLHPFELTENLFCGCPSAASPGPTCYHPSSRHHRAPPHLAALEHIHALWPSGCPRLSLLAAANIAPARVCSTRSPCPRTKAALEQGSWAGFSQS